MKQNYGICPVCDQQGTLSDVSYSDTLLVGGKEMKVEGLISALCSACGAEPLLPTHITHNQRIVADAKRKQLGLLTGEQIRNIRKRLGLSQKLAAEVFGGGAHAFSKYERGDVIQSTPMDKLLRVVGLCPDVAQVLTMEVHGRHFVMIDYEAVEPAQWSACTSEPARDAGQHWSMRLAGKFQRKVGNDEWHEGATV